MVQFSVLTAVGYYPDKGFALLFAYKLKKLRADYMI